MVVNNKNTKKVDLLEKEVNDIADMLCTAINGDFDFFVTTDSKSETVHKLVLLINFVLDTVRRTLDSTMQQNILLTNKSEDLKRLNIKLISEAKERQGAELKLKEMHQQMLDISREAGMSQIATEILHNVGNALNTTNASISQIHEILSNSRVENLILIGKKLDAEVSDSDIEIKEMVTYLLKLSTYISDCFKHIKEEAKNLSVRCEHIKHIIQTQQSVAKKTMITEMASINDLIKQTLELTNSNFTADNIKLQTDFADLPIMLIDRHKLILILTNLIKNSYSSLKSCNKSDRKLSIITNMQDKDVVIRVIDNGKGISKENLVNIFRHGFTTKKDGHGFGLHSSANVAKEMGGELSADSPGVDKGATFSLRLPVRKN